MIRGAVAAGDDDDAGLEARIPVDIVRQQRGFPNN